MAAVKERIPEIEQPKVWEGVEASTSYSAAEERR